MSKNKHIAEIISLSAEIKANSNNCELYYQRGYLYFLLNEDTKAKEDYRKAVELGLDYTENPYYTFAATNTKRRDFLLPEKIMIALVLVIVGLTLFTQFVNWYLKIRSMF